MIDLDRLASQCLADYAVSSRPPFHGFAAGYFKVASDVNPGLRPLKSDFLAIVETAWNTRRELTRKTPHAYTQVRGARP